MIRLITSTIVLLMLFSIVQAKEAATKVVTHLVNKTVCASTFGQEPKQFQEQLLTRAKRAVVEDVCGSLVKSFSKVKNFRLENDEIESYSRGYVRVKGDPIPSNGKNIGEVCLTIHAEISQEDCDKITKPKRLSKKACVCEGDIKTIKERAEQKAKLEVLFDYDQNLREYPVKKILPLLREVTFPESHFVEGTSVYCVEATGSLYPIEVFALTAKEGKPAAEQFVQGLTAEYFNLRPFSKAPGDFSKQSPTFKRIDNTIDFSWAATPAPSVSADYFGVRWTGMIFLPKTGTYLFSNSFRYGGIKLFIDNKAVIERWTLCGSCQEENNRYFQGDKWYPIKVEFFHQREVAKMKLSWRIPGSDSTEIISPNYLKTKPIGK